MSTAISLSNISKRYRLGTVNQRMLLDDLRDWRDRVFSRGKPVAAPRPTASPEFWALKDISFDIKKGETVGLIGTNGAGKSTLLKLLARVTTPTTGEMVINGRVGTLLEVGSGFHPELTGRDNVFLNGAVLGMSRAEIESKFDEILDFAELHQFIDTPVKRYSSGMRVRLAFSVAAIIEPEIMILDEVLAVGDFGFREKCLHRIEVLASGGQTGLFVSHSIGHVLRLCSRVIWLEKGTVRMDGDTDVVCEEYRKAQIIKLAVHSPAPALHLGGESKNSAYQILGVETRDGLGRVAGRFRTGDTCHIAVKYANNFQLNEKIEKVTLRLSILNEQGNRLIGLDSSLVKPKLVPLPDSSTICFAIPKLPLMAGTYSFSVAFSINGELMDKVIPETFFRVEDGDFYGTQRVASATFTPLCVEFDCYLEEAGRNPAYQLLEVETRDKFGTAANRFRTGETCCVAVKYAKNFPLDEEITRVTLRLSFVNQQGIRVLGLESALVKPKILPFPDAARICFELPRLPLVDGTYSFALSLMINGVVIDESTPDVFLYVEEGDFYGTGRATRAAFTPLSVDFNCYLEEAGHPLCLSSAKDSNSGSEQQRDRSYSILDIETQDGFGRLASLLRTGEACRIVVKYEKHSPLDEEIQSVELELLVLNKQGFRLLGLDSSLIKPKLVPFPDAGAICFEIPRLPLTAGVYSLSLSLIINGEVAHQVVRAGSLLVEKGDFFGTGRAVPTSLTPLAIDFNCCLEERKNPAYQIVNLETQDGSGCPVSRLRTGEACRIAVTCIKKFPLDTGITSSKMKLLILNEQGCRLLGLDSRMVRHGPDPFPDEATVVFELPKLPLAAGTYTFSLSLIMNGELIDRITPAVSLLVEKGDFHGSGLAAPASFTPLSVDFNCYIEEKNNSSSPEA